MLTARLRGFTLIEALVALAILLSGLAGAGFVLLQSVQHERESANRRSAVRLAASLADELRARAGAPAPVADLVDAWREAVAAALPAGAAADVTTAPGVPATYEVRIEWPVSGIGVQRIVVPVTP